MLNFIKENKMIAFFCIVAALFFFFLGQSYASEYHHYVSANEPANEPAKITTIQQSDGVATAIAIGQHQFDSSTFAWQGSISTGSYDDSTAFSFGLAKRFRATLISGSVANEGGKIGYGASLGFKF